MVPYGSSVQLLQVRNDRFERVLDAFHFTRGQAARRVHIHLVGEAQQRQTQTPAAGREKDVRFAPIAEIGPPCDHALLLHRRQHERRRRAVDANPLA